MLVILGRFEFVGTYLSAIGNAVVTPQSVTFLVVVAPPDSTTERAAHSPADSRSTTQRRLVADLTQILDTVENGTFLGVVAFNLAVDKGPIIAATTTSLEGIFFRILVIIRDSEIRVKVGVLLQKFVVNLLSCAIELNELAVGECLDLPFDGNLSITFGKIVSGVKILGRYSLNRKGEKASSKERLGKSGSDYFG